MGMYLFVDGVNNACWWSLSSSFFWSSMVISELLGGFYICKYIFNTEMSLDDRQQVHEKQPFVISTDYFRDIS